jgi:asparagine synthase (glutamine-hydrolysing)
MCGVNGIYHFNRDEPVDEATLLQMRDALYHRGPDEAGCYLNGNVGFGHRRLSIVDLAHGQQPLCNEDGTVWITYNGEIFNHNELRRLLIDKGHQFRTRCDTETIVHLYEEYGANGVQKLRGQFAFAIWDARKQRLLLARDQLGILPLSYALDNGRLIFASEIKAILRDRTISREIDLHALTDYLTYRYVPSPRTIFKQVRKLPPGHILICEQGAVSVRRYWTLNYQPDNQAKEAEYIEKIRDKLQEAVKIRLMSEVPLGAFLSGGIDSSVVVAFMSRVVDRPKTFSIGFGEQDFDELRYARLVAEHFGTEHYEFRVTSKAKELLPRLVKQFDEPFADPSAIPTYYVAKMARQHVTVCLTGDGGDETFAGYKRYEMVLRSHRLRVIPGAVRRPIFHTLSRLIPSGARGKLFAQQVSMASPVDAYALAQGYLHPSSRDPLLSEEVKATLNGERPYELLHELYDEAGPVDYLARIQYIDFMSYLPGQILVKVDRTGMLNSLETRPPLLDHELLELMATTPPNFRIRGSQLKYILKQVARDFLPAEILNRPKQGFGVPLKYWFEEDWKTYTAELLLDPQAISRRFLDQKRVRAMLDEHSSSRKDFSLLLYRLLIFEEWSRCYMDESRV